MLHDFFINPSRLAVLATQFLPRLSLFKNGEVSAQCSAVDIDADSNRQYSVQNRVAIIDIRGALASRQIPGWSWYADSTYEGIVDKVEAAVNSPDIDSILLSINSPGGTVIGCAEAAMRLNELAEQKDIVAHCITADSAAYWLASAAGRIVVDPTGEVGSIGVITSHFDISKMLENWGVKVTHIFSGDAKADGSPYNQLGDEAHGRIKADIDHLRGIFVENVAANRLMSADDVYNTQAQTFIGTLAVNSGLADDTGFFSDVLKEMAAAPSASTTQTTTKETKMAKKPNAAARPKKTAETPKDDTTEKDAAGQEDEEGDGTADDDEEQPENEEGEEKPSASSEKTRIASILNNKEAAGRGQLAQTLALETNLSVEEAEKVMKSAAKEQPKGNTLGSHVKTHGNPDVGAEGGKPVASANKVIDAMKARIAAG